MDQRAARKLSERRKTSIERLVIYEIARARTAVLSRVASDNRWGIYVIYKDPRLKSFKNYCALIISKMNDDDYTALIDHSTDEYAVLKILWKHTFCNLPEDI